MTTQLPASVIEEANDDADLDYVRHQRKKIIEKIFAKGAPENTDDTRIALVALADMDRAALGRKKIKVEEKTNATQEAAAGIISQLLMQAAAAGNQPYRSAIPVERELPVLGNDIPAPILVPGETSTEIIHDDFDSFMARTSLPNE